MSHWDDATSDDMPTCIDCGARVDGSKYGPGVFQCISCAVGDVLDAEPAKPRLCGCGVELTGMGVLCPKCEQEGIKATAWVADVDWAQPGYPTKEDIAEYEAWLDTMNGRLDEHR